MKTKHFYPILFALLLLSFVSKAQDGIYLYYPGVTDQVTGPVGHTDEVVILAFSNGFSNNGITTNFQDYSFTKYNDAATSYLQTALVSQSATDGVELRIYKGGVKIQTQQLKGVKVTSYSAGGSAGELGGGCSTCTGLTENVSVSFTGIKIGAFSNNF